MFTIASAAFIFVTAEVLPVGLLPQISSSLAVSEGTVGLLLTVYAALAGLSAIPMTMRLSRVSRDRLLVVLMSVFTLSTLLAALAPNYALLAASRLICAMAHGVFWAILTPTVARIVGPMRAGRSAAKVFMGTALATVIGVPLTTALGRHPRMAGGHGGRRRSSACSCRSHCAPCSRSCPRRSGTPGSRCAASSAPAACGRSRRPRP